MRTLVLPLSTDSDGVIIDGNGHEIADLWAIDKAGKMRVTEESEAAMRERAAEIVLRVNMHNELVDALRYSRDRLLRDGRSTEELNYILDNLRQAR